MPSPTAVLLRTQSDDRLVALARAGHERAFEAIVERYRKPLVRACRRVLPEARAEDAVQQALVAAWTGLARGDDVRELRPWLYRIAHNTALNQLRISGYDHDELHSLLTIGAGPEDELERRHVARATLTGLAALPERQREALLQVAVQGRGQEEVARALGISEPAVRQLVHRARTRLRTAATALTPMPLAGWFADLGGRSTPVTDRIGELVAGGGAAGVAATVAKVGTVVVLAGGVAAGPGVVDRLGHGTHGARQPVSALGASDAAAAEPSRPTATPAVLRVVSAPVHASAPTRPAAPRRRSGSGGSGGSERRHGRDDAAAAPLRSSPGDDHSGRSHGDGSSGDDGTPTTTERSVQPQDTPSPESSAPSDLSPDEPDDHSKPPGTSGSGIPGGATPSLPDAPPVDHASGD
jgi:RNA polymerase sigma factor (sigma-70 family)